MKLKQDVERLQGQKQELLNCASVGDQGVASLKERLWELESKAVEQQKIHSQQENTIKQLEQVRSPSLSRRCAVLGEALTQRGSMKKIHRAALLLLLSRLWLPVTLKIHKEARHLQEPISQPQPPLCCCLYWPHQAQWHTVQCSSPTET